MAESVEPLTAAMGAAFARCGRAASSALLQFGRLGKAN